MEKNEGLSIFDKIFSGGAKALTDSIGGVVDNIVTTDDEKAKAKQALTETVLNALNESLRLQHNIIVSETQGNWLQRSWRPILMLCFGFIVMYRYFAAPTFGLPEADLPEQFWSLLEIGIGGYVIGRSVEKTVDSVVKNVDISFVRKKDRG